MPLSVFCSPTEKISATRPPNFIIKTREIMRHLTMVYESIFCFWVMYPILIESVVRVICLFL